MAEKVLLWAPTPSQLTGVRAHTSYGSGSVVLTGSSAPLTHRGSAGVCVLLPA